MLPSLDVLLYWSLLVFLVMVGLGVLYFVVMGTVLLAVHALLRYARWRDRRQSNRERQALGLPPLSGIHWW